MGEYRPLAFSVRQVVASLDLSCQDGRCSPSMALVLGQ